MTKNKIHPLYVQVEPAQALNVPVVPLGALLAAAYPLAFRPPYFISWLNSLITAQDTMDPELMEKFVLNNFCKYIVFPLLSREMVEVFHLQFS